ncbi:uncharacterized protein BJ171DRAFT_537024 [Polychytrium aggregatum]|uniref:uncharacterized protein n=1 Tax=Polychytrium aggregatum TaxID=110093 RepID=UPI0022FE3E36|nr:uncharacterized protein BJ171DRAFT_543790 [Polychytrium aggregatum]XP_052961886.1 uncharacterized protein BJ171DRAFT_537024 [Polychytrium aggregatum]KAI9190599.1 hypothetical protein BJ171DRAFT_543790 [Polychytrium aggregatum]KAI9192948.1 hypothetical protein BJ171DRAFT_537024 [Polychytrium aggregatum]
MHPSSLMKGLQFYATKNIKPAEDELREIVSASGGTMIQRVDESPDENTIVLGCHEDEEECQALAQKGWTIHTNEFVMTGILRQRVEKERYHLSLPNRRANPPASSQRPRKASRKHS